MRGERGARVELAERGRNICLHFPEPFSPSSFAFSSHGRQQPGREEREEEGGGEEKKKSYRSKDDGRVCSNQMQEFTFALGSTMFIII